MPQRRGFLFCICIILIFCKDTKFQILHTEGNKPKVLFIGEVQKFRVMKLTSSIVMSLLCKRYDIIAFVALTVPQAHHNLA